MSFFPATTPDMEAEAEEPLRGFQQEIPKHDDITTYKEIR